MNHFLSFLASRTDTFTRSVQIGELMVSLGVPLDKSAPGTDLKRAFFVDLDVNGDGRISLDEFLATVEKRTNVITANTSTAWKEIIKCMDYNGLDASYMFEKVCTDVCEVVFFF